MTHFIEQRCHVFMSLQTTPPSHDFVGTQIRESLRLQARIPDCRWTNGQCGALLGAIHQIQHHKEVLPGGDR
jgi:hypothetical protein